MAGSGNPCALRSDGEAVCWGATTAPDGIPIPPGPFVDLTAGEVRCWGETLKEIARRSQCEPA